MCIEVYTGKMPYFPVLMKKVPQNAKYASVQSVVNTCAPKRVSLFSDQQIAKRRGELFKRMSCAHLADWLKNWVGDQGDECVSDITCGVECVGDASSVLSLGVQSVAVTSVVDSNALPSQYTRGLLVDLREFEDYLKNRICHSMNFPGVLITREIIRNPILNGSKKLMVIVYHSDDRQSSQFGALLVEKGWESVCVLNGGFDEFKSSYPEMICTNAAVYCCLSC